MSTKHAEQGRSGFYGKCSPCIPQFGSPQNVFTPLLVTKCLILTEHIAT